MMTAKTRTCAALSILVLAIFGCTTTGTTSNAAAQQQTSEFRNLQVLPRDLTREQLLAIMRTFTRGLGVRCNHCHVVTATTPKEELDFASDAKEEKRVARVMIQMTRQINTEWLARVEAAEGEDHGPSAATPTAPMLLQPRVGCWTCHRGRPEPEMPPPPPAPGQPQQPASQP
jgi:nitrate/TMAO reductase-like tetraheme cytochrome c subunit